MDPSEFEDCVSREGAVLHAGKLEELLHGEPTTFTHLDLSKESGDIFLSIFNLQQTVDKMSAGVSLDNFVAAQDEQALKLAELKEDYVKRRKVLTGKVKAYTAGFLEVRDPQKLTVDHALEMIDRSSELVDNFKKEFDNLSHLSKFSEGAFLTLYKRVREMPDLVQLVRQALQACLRLNEVLKRAQDQLNVAQKLLAVEEETDASRQPAGKLVAEIEAMRQKFEAEREEARQLALSQLVDLKTSFEVEQRNREVALNSKYEQQLLDAQHRTDSLLASKEAYIGGLLASLQDYQQRALVFEERGRVLEQEDTKRKVAEDKLREALVTNADLASALDKSRSDAAVLAATLQDVQATVQVERESTAATLGALREELHSLQERMRHTQAELERRPPIDLEGLAGRIGYALGEEGTENSWSAVETFICDTMRKQGSELIALRVRDAEMSRQLERTSKLSDDLATKLAARENEAQELEREIAVAQQANRSARQAAITATPTSRARAPAADSASHDETPSDPWSLPFDLEADSGDTHKLISPTLSSKGDESITQVLQNQRDRYMRSAQTMQGEVTQLRNKLERLQEEQTQLRNENLELYRRLRVLRLKNGGPPSEVRSRRSVDMRGGETDDWSTGTGGGGGYQDALDSKYLALYEEELSPFHVEEMDKQQVLSKMRIVDRVLAYLLRYAMLDSWTRQAFLCYMVLVHIFALIYCFKVLNPELAGEVDAHLKARWSEETLSMQEHPDA